MQHIYIYFFLLVKFKRIIDLTQKIKLNETAPLFSISRNIFLQMKRRRSQAYSSYVSSLSLQRESKVFILFFPLTELPERQIFNLLRQIEQQAKEDTNNHETGLSENFKRNIKEKGFSISDNQGEGNSMFLALSEQLHLKKRIKISQAELRQTVVQYLKKNPTLVSVSGFLTPVIQVCSSLVKISNYILWILVYLISGQNGK